MFRLGSKGHLSSWVKKLCSLFSIGKYLSSYSVVEIFPKNAIFVSNTDF